MFAPGISATEVEKLPLTAGTGVPATVTNTAFASLTVPLNVVIVATTCAPSAGEATSSVGGVRSSVKCTIDWLRLPAVSAALTTNVCGPSAVTIVPLTNGASSSVAVTVARLSSVAEKIGVTPAAFEYWPSKTPVTVITGGVVSGGGATVNGRTPDVLARKLVSPS